MSPARKTILAWCLIILALLMTLWAMAPVLAPFVVAAVLAYALTPLVDWLDSLGRGRLPRVVAVVLVESVFILVILGIALLMVPILAKELPLMRDQLPAMMESLNQALRPFLKQWGVSLNLDGASLRAFALKYFNANVEDAFASIMTSLKLGGSVALAVIGNAVLIPVALFYLLMDWGRFVARIHALIPPRLQPWAHDFLGEVDWVLGQYLRGQLLVMLLLAVYYSVALALFGLDLALPIGVFTGLAIFVPYLGFGLGLVLATLAGLLQFAQVQGIGHAFVMIAVVYGVGQLVESFVLTPRLVGERIGLHPLAVIFALLAFGQLFGFIGVLVALPASAVLLVALRRLQARYLDSPLYRA